MYKFFTFLWILGIFNSKAQNVDLSYYLPITSYDPKITKPADFLGYEVGEQHVSHDQLYFYMKLLCTQSNRLKLVEYARSYENRPLIVLLITSKSNHENLDKLKTAHIEWASGNGKSIDNVPLVFYQGYSIHGNEASGSNAALTTAYYLAAAQDAFVDQLLDKTIILFDPSFNPDGMQRFSTWVNSNKSKMMVTDPGTREYNETWPGGRTNHYWFDLNRDWMPQQLPESKGRVKLFQEWKPNVLTDHHEQGSNSSFFFMPGEPTRVNPNTPKINQELTMDIARYHAEELNKIGSMYYTREGYDDYYYGKGSTYPDAQGCVGILFEQASSRGHAQSTDNGILTFPFAIRNHVKASLSSYKAVVELRSKLLNYQHDFYKSALDQAAKDPVKGYLLSAPNDIPRLNAFIDILLANKIKLYALQESKAGYAREESIVVPCSQSQYALLKGMMERRTKFEDSLFYDISAWTYPLAFNLQYQELGEADNINKWMGKEITTLLPLHAKEFVKSNYAYIIDGRNYNVYTALHILLSKGLRARIIQDEFELGNAAFKRGSILVPVQNQSLQADEIFTLLQSFAREYGLTIIPSNTGMATNGVDLGTPSSANLKLPKVAMLVGQGIDMNDAGEVWHLLDTRVQMPLALLDVLQFSNFNLDEYNTLVLVDGVYNALNAAHINKLKTWINAGGLVIAQGRAISWLNANGMADVTIKPTPGTFDNQTGMRVYANVQADAGTDVLAGAIFETKFDKTHPLAFGLLGNTIPFFRSNRVFMDIPKNGYASPFRYSDTPLMSGYVTKVNLDQLKGSAAIVVNVTGSGKVICIPDNLNFRAFWYGTNKVFMNAVFFGHFINANAAQRVVPKE